MNGTHEEKPTPLIRAPRLQSIELTRFGHHHVRIRQVTGSYTTLLTRDLWSGYQVASVAASSPFCLLTQQCNTLI